MGKKVTKALDCAKKVSKGFITIIVATVVYNPVVWLIWALINPSSAVDCLKGAANRNEPAWWYVRVWGLIDLILAYLMLWRVRREIIKVTGITLCYKDEIRGYKEKVLDFSSVGEKASKILWKTSAEYREEACRKSLQEDEFEAVLGDPELLGIYLKRTPSKRRIRRILEVYLEENTSPEVKETILNYVKFNGLPSDLALECTKDGIYSSIAEPVQEALALYKEVEDVKQLFKSDPIPWKAWLGKRNNLSVEAQAEMSEWQLREYVAQGFVLYEDLLIEYMKDETKRNWILSYVRGLKEKGHLTEKAYILLTTEKWWRIKMI